MSKPDIKTPHKNLRLTFEVTGPFTPEDFYAKTLQVQFKGGPIDGFTVVPRELEVTEVQPEALPE